MAIATARRKTPPPEISGKPCYVLFLASVENRGSLAQTCNDVEIVTADDIVLTGARSESPVASGGARMS